jgi:hypothetical protein
MTSIVSAPSGGSGMVDPLSSLLSFTGASADATPLPHSPSATPSTKMLIVSALAQAAALGVLTQQENAVTVAGSWARDLGQEERSTSTSAVHARDVSKQVSRAPSALQQAQLAATRAKAYAVFDRLLDDSTPSVIGEAQLAAFLGDPENKYRDALLACLADREVELEPGPLMMAVAQLLTAADSRTRRMAALALASSGEVGEAELGRGLDALSVEWAEDIRATLRLSA